MLQHDPIIRMTAREVRGCRNACTILNGLFGKLIMSAAMQVMNHKWVVTEGLARAGGDSNSPARAGSGATAPKSHQMETDEISTEVKREASRKSLREIKKTKSQKSFKVCHAKFLHTFRHGHRCILADLLTFCGITLQRLVGKDGGAKAHRSKSRFELLSDEDLNASDEDDNDTLPIGNGKSFFGDAGKESAPKSSSRRIRTGKNKIAVEP